jgi:hypothetical protein
MDIDLIGSSCRDFFGHFKTQEFFSVFKFFQKNRFTRSNFNISFAAVKDAFSRVIIVIFSANSSEALFGLGVFNLELDLKL